MDIRHEYCHLYATHIVNILAGDYPGGKSQLFARIYRHLMEMLCDVDEERAGRWKEPSEN